MHRKASYIQLSVIVICVLAEFVACETTKFCPAFCKCDVYNDRNRADCSSKRLINVNVEIPNTVELLDFSYNDITSLDNTCFRNYNFLRNLNLSHNAIHTISLDAFSKLRHLRDIDLSYNRLEYLDERLFESNRHLWSLNLEGNKFMTLPQRPLLRSTSLRSLNLRNSLLNYISIELLSAIPHLKYVDLGSNLLITFTVEAFNALRELRSINLVENPLVCDQTLMQRIKQLQRRGIDIIVETCKSNVGHGLQMLERMEMASHGPHSEESKEDSEVQPVQWKRPIYQQEYENDDDNSEEEDTEEVMENEDDKRAVLKFSDDPAFCQSTRQVLCHNYRKCLEKLSRVCFEQTINFTNNDIRLAFTMGTATGITTVICILICALCFKNCYELHKRDQYRETEVSQPINRQTSSRPQQRAPSHSAPLPRLHERSLAHREQFNESGRDNFIARLFGRPARHQYYRTLNQNTATLIRHLSRSNLFNNRLGQQFRDRARATSEPRSQESGDSNDDPMSPQRSETPPPKYRDVIALNN